MSKKSANINVGSSSGTDFETRDTVQQFLAKAGYSGASLGADHMVMQALGERMKVQTADGRELTINELKAQGYTVNVDLHDENSPKA